MDQINMLLQICVIVVLAMHRSFLVDSASATFEQLGAYDTTFTNQWAAHIVGGDKVADNVAARHGFINLGKVPCSVMLFLEWQILYKVN